MPYIRTARVRAVIHVTSANFGLRHTRTAQLVETIAESHLQTVKLFLFALPDMLYLVFPAAKLTKPLIKRSRKPIFGYATGAQ